jgi:hypothetical protein
LALTVKPVRSSGEKLFRCRFPGQSTQAFRGDVEQRNEENPEHGCSNHAAEHGPSFIRADHASECTEIFGSTAGEVRQCCFDKSGREKAFRLLESFVAGGRNLDSALVEVHASALVPPEPSASAT